MHIYYLLGWVKEPKETISNGITKPKAHIRYSERSLYSSYMENLKS
uniref:Uncharacterized protein n=1 Tax=Candidatus Kentrum sp. TC TaxID=2126339 RepID=A0A450ZPB2_9GAMM|nr:MAG: hypothetical protein BECKTC1821F_GA0114240_100756 [Candidatus Kentron sp. TC]